MSDKSNLAKVIQNGLREPGNYFCNLFRTDGIIQNTLMEQLFANYYLKNKYTYEVTSPQEGELSALNAEFYSNRTKLAKHIEECHNEEYDNLASFISCNTCQNSSECIGASLKIIHNQIVEYSNTFKMATLTMEENEEICEIVRNEHEKYSNFIVEMENKLPELSQQISNVKSKNFPFSLWKFLHEEFAELILTPLLQQILDCAFDKLEKSRRLSFEQVLKCIEQKRLFDNKVFEIKAIFEIIAHSSLTEVSVHFLESTKAGSSVEIENRLKNQTQSLYKEYGPKLRANKNVEKAFKKDQMLLEKAFLPCIAYKAMEECYNNAENYLIEAKEEKFNKVCFYIRDIEVESYTARLGLSLEVLS